VVRKEDALAENDGAFPESERSRADADARLSLDTLEKSPDFTSQIKLIRGYPTN